MSNETKPIVTWDAPLKGQKYIRECREQIQNDIITFIDVYYTSHDDPEEAQEVTNILCQIVVDNFKNLEK